MLYTDCTVTINGEKSVIDRPVVLYRGDKEVEIKFYIMKNTFYQSIVTRTTNVVSDVDASFSQLVIRVPEGEPIFSAVTPVEEDGAIIFKFTAEMIDEVQEVGAYDFQIRLLDENRTSRATIPPVTGGIKIKEPIAIENVANTNEVNLAKVNEAVTTTATPLPAFDEQGNYIETTWADKMLITDAKLNKIEAGIDGVNKKVASVAVVGKDAIGNENIKYKSISKNKLNFTVKCGNNLFDMNDVNREGFINTDGSFVASDTYFDSGFISVEPNTNYCSNIPGFHVAYDIDKNFIGRIAKDSNLFTTPANCYFIKVACPKDGLNGFMINKGDVLLPYEECVYKDKSLLIELNDVKGIEGIQLTENNCTFLTKKVGTNLFDKSKVISNKYYDKDNGTIGTLDGYNASDFIEVEEGVKYSWNSFGYVCYWDENKRYINGYNASNASDASKTIPTGMGIKYITFTIPTNALDRTMFVKGDLPATYIPYETYYQLNDNIVIQNTKHKLSGLKWNVLGDSITSTDYANKRYWEYISDEIGIEVNNYGISGSRIAVTQDHNQPMCIRYSNMNDADIITVFGGTNDFASKVTLGDITSTDTQTFYGALNVLCKGLIEKYPGKRLGFITPIQRDGVAYDDDKWVSYQNAIKEVCAKYSIPVLDGTRECGLAISSVSSIMNRYTIDGLHLNDDGHKIFARRILSFIESL